jgi:signal transduction histidine kinase
VNGTNRVERLNILLVDDQPAKLLGYEAILAELGENLIKARSAREALHVLLEQDVALILVDVCMPELDGFELVQLIRDHPRHRRASIIFVSAINVTDLDRLRGYESGAVDYMSVPLVPEILRARVMVFLDLYRKTNALEALNRELEARVAERTAALEEADRRKDVFLATLAHELRNPLAPIRNALHLLGADGVGEERRTQSREMIQRQVDHMVRLVDDLLDVSRISSGKISLRLERTDVDDVVTRAIETCQPLVDARGIRLSVSVGEPSLCVLGDSTRLVQVLCNVLHNAVKYSGDGGEVVVSVQVEGTDVVVSVRDDGIGIPADMLPRVFDLFTQVRGTVGAAEGGLGIGLALARRLAEMHGGSLEARSEGAGQGSTFVLRLPLPIDPDLETHEPVAVPVVVPSRKLRILVADDNEDAADSLAMVLEGAGHTVTTVYDGHAAIESAEATRPDVIVLDIGMPKLDGYEAARRIRKTPWGAEVFLVALTGWGQADDRRQAAEAGFDVHLTKPVEPAHLAAVLAKGRPSASPP